MLYDVTVIGGGVLGCFAARNLSRRQLKTVLLEKESDICSGITRANAAVCYAGYDHVPGSLKAQLTLAANAGMASLCEELEVPFARRGSLMAAFGPRGEAVLRKKLAQGTASGVPGLELLSGAEAREREPMLTPDVTAALYAPGTGTVNPWQLGIAALENAVGNGCETRMSSAVRSIRKEGEYYVLETERETIRSRAVINCAGLAADRVQELLFPPRVRLFTDASDFLVFDRHAPAPSHILFQETEAKGKGISAVPTTEGNLLLEGPARPLSREPFGTAPEALSELRTLASRLLPGLDYSAVIRNFGAIRPNPRKMVFRDGAWQTEDKNISSFVIDDPEPGFLSLIGIKTPGLTCADTLGRHLAERLAEYLGAGLNPAFEPRRKAIVRLSSLSAADRAARIRENPSYGRVVCQCEDITKGEIEEAIARGAVSPDGVKRRLGSGMGPCQGSRCTREIELILEECGRGKL